MSRAVKQAKECSSENDIVFVSTDSENIQKEAEMNGIEIPFLRPSNLASDTSSTYSVILHVLDEFKNRGIEFEKVILLQPTSPFRTIKDIKGTIDLWNPEIDMAVSVNESKANPYFTLFETGEGGFLHHSKGNGEFTRRQDAPKVWEYNGAVYVMTTSSLLRSPLSEFKKVLPYKMPSNRSIDLDTPEDWEIAEFIFFKKELKNKG